MVRLVFVTFLSAVLLGTVLASNTPFRPYYLPPFFLHIFNISKINNEIGRNFSLNQQNTSESVNGLINYHLLPHKHKKPVNISGHNEQGNNRR